MLEFVVIVKAGVVDYSCQSDHLLPESVAVPVRIQARATGRILLVSPKAFLVS